MRQNLINHVNNVLIPMGFSRQGDDFTKEFDHATPGGEMNINGRIIRMPDRKAHYTFLINLLGTGSISDDKSYEEFECVEFIVQEDNEIKQSVEVAIYYNQINEFNEYLKMCFGL